VKPDSILDCIGLYCPMPIIKAAEAIKTMTPGQILEIVADDRGIKADMAAWCKSTGNELLEIQEDRGEYRVYVRKR